jgi:hypothetical protein
MTSGPKQRRDMVTAQLAGGEMNQDTKISTYATCTRGSRSVFVFTQHEPASRFFSRLGKTTVVYWYEWLPVIPVKIPSEIVQMNR